MLKLLTLFPFFPPSLLFNFTFNTVHATGVKGREKIREIEGKECAILYCLYAVQ